MTVKNWPGCVVTMALLAILAIPSSSSLAQEQEGWAISPSEVRVDGISLGESTEFSITIVNNKDFTVCFSMSSSTPTLDRLIPGYQPIPDTAWIRFNPQLIELAAYSRQKVTVTVDIPFEGEWGGKTYECWLSATSETMGILQVKLDCRLLLSTSTAYPPGVNWVLIGSIVSVVIIAGGVIYSYRRGLKRWLSRW